MRIGRNLKPARSIAVVCFLLLFSSGSGFASGIVTTLDETHLRSALSGGGAITFSADGVITLAAPIEVATDTVLDGSGHNVVISGGNVTKLFQVNSGINFSAKNLTLANGRITGASGRIASPSTSAQDGYGAGILSLGGNVALTSCILTNHHATGGSADQTSLAGVQFTQSGANGFGAAICMLGGELDATNCSIAANGSVGGLGSQANANNDTGTAGSALGGAVYAVNAKVNFQGVNLSANTCQGAKSRDVAARGQSGNGAGGAFYCVVSTVYFENSVLTDNVALGGDSDEAHSTSVGFASGGAIFVGPDSSALIRTTSLSANKAQSGSGFDSELSTVAGGGAIFVGGNVTLENCVFSNNSSQIGNQTSLTSSGYGRGGAIYSTNTLSISACTFSGNNAHGGWGIVDGPAAEGGAIWSSGSLNATNSTLVSNVAAGGAAPGDTLTGGIAQGGGVCLAGGAANLVNVTVADNQASGGNPAGASQGGGLSSSNSTVRLRNSILSHSLSGGNAWGVIVDAGYNLSSDGTASFSAVGSLNNTDPLLAALGANGGVTPTMSLLPGSPAHNAIPIPSGFPPTDQRGTVRPQGPAADIGAFEADIAGTAPSIVTQPQAKSVRAGSNVDFNVVASGTAPLGYQWRKDGNPISGATQSSLSLANVQAANIGIYSVLVTNTAGTTPSQGAALAIDSTPLILVQPASVSTPAGATVNFSVAADGPALSYQWWHGQTQIGGATGSTLSLANVGPGAQGNYYVVVANFARSVTSTAASLSFDASTLSIQVPPQALTVVRGTPASFTVQVAGIQPFAYQWHHNGTDLAGATSRTFNILATTDNDAGSYGVIINNGYRTIASDDVQLTVTAGSPIITTQPQGKTVRAGSNVDFSVVASGPSPLSYQWRRDGNPISGATNPTLSLSNVQAANGGTYTVMVSNGGGSTPSQGALLVVDSSPLIVTQPASVLTPAGANVSFSVSAQGPSLSYQWWHDQTPINGATGPTLSLPNVAAGAQGNYYVVVSNFGGSVNSSVVTLTFDSTTLNILTSPRNTSAVRGTSTSLSVVVSGIAPFIYEWRHNGTTIAGATSSTLNLPVVTDNDAGRYNVVVSNGYRTATSDDAQLTVTSGAPVISSQPQGRTVRAGNNVDFTVVATGSGTLSYQWRKDGNPISGATTAILSLSNVQAVNGGAYSVLISNAAGSTPSQDAVLVVDSSPLIVTQPASVNVGAGAGATFSVTATGPNLSYQWWHGQTQIGGATATSLVFPSAGPGAQGSYFVVVSNFAAAVTSVVASLTFDATTLSILVPPQSQSVTRGNSASFSVAVSGVAPFTYEWRHNGSTIAGATTSTLNLAAVTDNDGGPYNVRVSNGYRSLTSDDAQLTVTAATPTIVTQPQGKTVRAGSNVDFTVVATGSGTLSYQWRKDGNPISGATTTILSLSNVQATNGGAYSVLVSNGEGSTPSQNALLVVDSSPLIVTQPVSANVGAGARVTFGVTATGPGLGYQWWHDRARVAGATAANLVLASAGAGAQGNYFVVVTNFAAAVTSVVATLTFDSTALNIVTPPSDLSVARGSPASFSVSVSGLAPFSYQWQRNGTNLAGATTSVFAISVAATNDAGSYSVTVTNGYRTVTSAAAQLTVTDIPVAPLLRINRNGPNVIVSFQAEAGRNYRLLSSTNFLNWSPVATNSTTTAGQSQFVRTYPKSKEFYRVVTP